jgi:predicted permease
MLRPLPVSHSARLYRIGDDDTGRIEGGPQGQWGFFPFALYQRFQDAAPEFEEIAAFDWGHTQFSVRRQGVETAARPLRSEYVTGNYFSTLGVGASRGRVLGPADDRPSAPPVVVLSHHAWQGAYGADPSIVGATLVVEGQPFTVAGVAARGFFGETLRGDPPDLWIPLQQEPAIAGGGALLHQPTAAWLYVIGRLRPGATAAGVAPRLTALIRRWIQYDAGYPANWMPDIVRDLPRQSVHVVPAAAGIGQLTEQYGASLRILLAICGMVLLIACANVANLRLARAVAARAQTAVRIALGATRRQIVAEALTESVLLAVAGGLAGLLVAMGVARLLVTLAFRNSQFVPIVTTPSLGVLAFAFALSLVTGMAFGAAPAWFATRTDPIDALRGTGRNIGDRASHARAALAALQAILSVVLVSGAMMLARSLDNLERQDFGYPVHGRVLVGLNRLPADYTAERLARLYRELDERLARLPGVHGHGLALYNPLAANWGEFVWVAGHPAPARAESGASWDRVSPDYLPNLGVTILRGRGFTAADNESAAPVAIVNETFVKRFFRAGEDPLEQHFGIELPENAGTFRIVGIARDARFVRSALNAPARPMFFMPLAQSVDYKSAHMKMVDLLSHFIQGILLVTDSPTGDLEPRLRNTLASADPNLTIISLRSMSQQIGVLADRERTVAGLTELFGMIALVLAAVGIYGVTAYMVARQTSEIGIRMALGADRVRVARLVLRQSFRPVVVGLLAGLPLAMASGKWMAGELYGVSFRDPLALGIAAGSLAVCALAAAIVPAARAAAISPMSALRNE